MLAIQATNIAHFLIGSWPGLGSVFCPVLKKDLCSSSRTPWLPILLAFSACPPPQKQRYKTLEKEGCYLSSCCRLTCKAFFLFFLASAKKKIWCLAERGEFCCVYSGDVISVSVATANPRPT